MSAFDFKCWRQILSQLYGYVMLNSYIIQPLALYIVYNADTYIMLPLTLGNLPSSFPLNLHRKKIIQFFFFCCFRMHIFLKCLFTDYVHQIILCFNLRYSKLSLLSQRTFQFTELILSHCSTQY